MIVHMHLINKQLLSSESELTNVNSMELAHQFKLTTKLKIATKVNA